MAASASRRRRTATNVSLDAELVAEAKDLRVNLSQASQLGVENAVKEARAKRWLEENREALESSNAWVEKNGLPLAKYRLF
ncbi:MAG TPA: type II toxin-antitoxin system CcdA family antitoxin [Sphingomicrobium sp.]|nr:type II toxin-antitoxin system CcdA family antitoxin [Sphingomicrobium sp.]